jgi:5-formyltetrahydrofolate cyclo-ligase
MKKEDLRKLYLKMRKDLPPEEIERRSEQIAERILEEIDFSKHNLVHCFLPINAKSEVNTHILITKLKENFPHIQIIIPVTDLNEVKMHSHHWKGEKLSENKWGIPEPVNVRLVNDSEIDIIIVPLLTFDLSGHRVGYGKGFYDKFFLGCKENVLKIGVSLFSPVSQIEDYSLTDIPLTLAVTPEKIYKFG